MTYVWFDALLNYVSASAPPDGDRFGGSGRYVHHLIGKDILKPHGIYWPCMLKAAGLLRDEASSDAGLPDFARLQVHGYWTLGGGKISKSVGNVVEALALTRTYGNDAFRYFVLREMPFGQDASFTEEALVERLNADLANDLGNLASRATTMLVNFARQVAGRRRLRGRRRRRSPGGPPGRRAGSPPPWTTSPFHAALVEIWASSARSIGTSTPRGRGRSRRIRRSNRGWPPSW